MSRPPVEPPTSASPAASDAAPAPGADRGTTSRRAFLRLGSLAAAGAAGSVAAPAEAAAQTSRPARTAQPRDGQPPKRLRAPKLAKRFAGVDQARQPAWLAEPGDSWGTLSLRLARRVTLGITPREAERAIALAYDGYLDYQLDHEQIDDSAVEGVVATRYPLLAQTGAQLATADRNAAQQQLQEATLYRAAFSQRQLYQRMVEFWSDHFTIYAPKVGYLKLLDDREVIRKHALGKFPDMLRASAKSAAMLVYLDQQTSRWQAPNQNYARELLELHTMGADGGYTQQDVSELARALTGWSISGRGDFAFINSYHDYGAKTILGRQIPALPASAGAQGVRDGEMVLDWLVDHPSTARFLATKMLRWLLWYEPTEQMVDRVAGVYTATKGDIRSMVRASLDPAYLIQAPAKLKRPFHFLVSALRGLPVTTLNRVTNLSRLLPSLGQPLFLWETPDGYPDQVEYWAGNLLPRWNVATTLASYSAGDIVVDVAPLTRIGYPEGVVAEIGRMLFGDEMSARTRDELVAYLRPAPTSATRIRETMALALASSEFQWY